MYQDWLSDPENQSITTNDMYAADVIWLLADWCANQISYELLKNKKVLTTVHHIVPEKFDVNARQEFQRRDAVTTAYQVFNQRVYDFIRPLTQKSIHVVPYWANQHLWRPVLQTKSELRKKWGIPEHLYLIGSMQRDSEGVRITRGPGDYKCKLEKGPDLFVEAVVKLATERKDLAVFLGGWRRDWIIHQLLIRAPQVPIYTTDPRERFETFGSPAYWIDRPSVVQVVNSTKGKGMLEIRPGFDLAKFLPPQQVVNEMYQMLDLYAVTSRCEGGPQALIEAGLTGTPVVSTPVGIAEQVLPASAIHLDVTQAQPAVPDVSQMLLPSAFEAYRDLLLSL